VGGATLEGTTMILRTILLAGCLVVPQLSSAAPMPVPPEKAAYVGDWQGNKMRLHIAQNGKIAYKRDKPDKNVDLNIELQGFNGNNFDAGALFIHSTFVVSKPPYREGGKWKMIVDGVELTKVE
jgi:hypothetical protein